VKDFVIHPCCEVIVGFGHEVEIAVPSFISVIGDGAFAWRITVRTVFIPLRVENLRAHSFSNCWELQDVSFEDNSRLKLIESSAFINCRSLEEIKIPGLVESLGSDCLSGCTRLKTVIFFGDAVLK
jgi:hypothetical protein